VEGRGQARGEVGMACINMNTSNLILCQFNDTQTYHKVIAKVNIFRPFEVLYIESYSELIFCYQMMITHSFKTEHVISDLDADN
jgi:DNA mismatch repair ATPase MutS